MIFVERLHAQAAAAEPRCHREDAPDVGCLRAAPPLERRQRAGRLERDELGAVGFDAELRDRVDRQRLRLFGEVDGRQKCDGARDAGPQRPRLRLVGRGKRHRVARECGVAAIDLGALLRLLRRADEDAQAQAIGDLGTQLAFFRIHRSDQRESRRILDGLLAPFDAHHALRGRIEQRVHHGVRKQIDLVDVQDRAVRARQHSGPKRHLTLFERRTDVDRSDDVVDLRVRGQLDDLGARFARRCRRLPRGTGFAK